MFLVVSACSIGRVADDAACDEIYRQLCAGCHGADLNGGIGPPLGPGSNTAGRPREFLEFTVIHGRGRMPSFSSSLNDEQLERLVSYLREEQGG
jgi:mono/diheme cytochrome c family protein